MKISYVIFCLFLIKYQEQNSLKSKFLGIDPCATKVYENLSSIIFIHRNSISYLVLHKKQEFISSALLLWHKLFYLSRSSSKLFSNFESTSSDVSSIPAISDDVLLTISAREVGQIAANLPSDQVKALKQRRRTLKNREYAGLCFTDHNYWSLLWKWNCFSDDFSITFEAICRSKRSHRGKELRESCDQLQMKVQQLEKQNELFKITLRKIDEVVNDLGISLDGSGKSEANIEFKHG